MTATMQFLIVTLLFYVLFDSTNGQPQGNFFLKAAKSVPRIGRSNAKNNNNIDEMGKFFMKASKSVPRIGRRNQHSHEYKPSPSYVYDYDQPQGEMIEKRAHYPIWSELADRFEYEPELFASPDVLSLLEQEMGDDPSVYEWDKVRVKRATGIQKFGPGDDSRSPNHKNAPKM